MRVIVLLVALGGLSGCATFREVADAAAGAAADTVREDLPRILGETAAGAISAGTKGDLGGALTAVISGLGALGLAWIGHARGRMVGEKKGIKYARNDLVAEKVLGAGSA